MYFYVVWKENSFTPKESGQFLVSRPLLGGCHAEARPDAPSRSYQHWVRAVPPRARTLHTHSHGCSCFCLRDVASLVTTKLFLVLQEMFQRSTEVLRWQLFSFLVSTAQFRKDGTRETYLIQPSAQTATPAIS